MKKIFFALMMVTSLISAAQDCKPSPHLYLGGGIGYGMHETGDGFLVNTNIGIATNVVGIDGSATTFPHTSAPTVFAAHITKPFYSGNTKITVGVGRAYTLISADEPEFNSKDWSGLFEVTKISYKIDAAIYFRGAVSGTNFLFTFGIYGIFKKN